MDAQLEAAPQAAPPKRRLSGQKLVISALVLVGLAVLGFTAWFVYHSLVIANHGYASAGRVAMNDTNSAVAVSLTKQYTDKLGLISAKYPTSWKIATKNSSIDSDHPIIDTTLTSPSGTVLHLYLDWGGRGGACFADPGDKPFHADNACPSGEFLSSEQTSIKNVYAYVGHTTNGSYSQLLDKSRIVLVTKEFADRAGKATYVMGLTASNSDYPITLHKPVMGAVYEDEEFAIYDSQGKPYGELHAYAYFAHQALLNSRDGQTVKAILQSVTVSPGYLSHSSVVDGAPGFKEYKNTDYGFSFQYPDTWTLKEDLHDAGRGEPEGMLSVTSPAGTVVHFDPNLGGKGGDCWDDKANKRTTRTCTTFNILSLDPFASGLAGRTFYLYQAKITPSTEEGGKSYYTIGLLDNQYDAPKLGPVLTPVAIDVLSPNSGDLNISFSGKDDADNASATFFGTTEVKEASSILKTLQILK